MHDHICKIMIGQIKLLKIKVRYTFNILVAIALELDPYACQIIKINNSIFTDWDEIYNDSLDKIVNNKIIPIANIIYCTRRDIINFLNILTLKQIKYLRNQIQWYNYRITIKN